MKTAIVYDRASSQNQKDNWSRADAEYIGVRLAQQHGFSQVEILTEVESGESLLNRPVMAAILDRCQAMQVGAIIVQNFSRLTRDEDGLDGLTIKKICKDNGVVVITPGKVYDFSTDQDDKLSDIELMVGRWYKAEMMKFTAQGLKARAREGRFMGGTPQFGYRLVYQQASEGEKPTADLAVNDKEAEAVKVLFDLYVNQRLGATGTMKKLNELGYKCRGELARGERPFILIDVLKFIRCELYIGFMRWGHNEEKSKYLKDFEGTMVHRPELQIIPVKLWEKAQKIREERKQQFKTPGATRGLHAFSGIVGCPHCGGPLRFGLNIDKRNNGRFPHYCCARSRAGHNDCKGFSISERLVAKALLPFVANVINKQVNINQALADAANQYGRSPVEDTIVNEIEVEIVSIQAEKARLIDFITSGVVTKEEAAAKLTGLREKEARLQRKLIDRQRKDEIRREYLEALTILAGADIEAKLFEMLEQKPAVLKRFLELFFKPASVLVRSWGGGSRRESEVTAYEFTVDFISVIGDTLPGEYHPLHYYLIELSELLSQ